MTELTKFHRKWSKVKCRNMEMQSLVLTQLKDDIIQPSNKIKNKQTYQCMSKAELEDRPVTDSFKFYQSA